MAAERAEKKENEKQDAQRVEVEAARAELTAADEKKKGDSKAEEEKTKESAERVEAGFARFYWTYVMAKSCCLRTSTAFCYVILDLMLGFIGRM